MSERDLRLIKLIIIGFVIFIIGGVSGYYLGISTRTITTQKLMAPTPTTTHVSPCAMDAKICPDGSSVGRTGPSCEFAACPITTPQIVPKYSCPDDGYITCSPILTNNTQSSCSPEALIWYQKNCSNFKGVTQ